MSKPYNDELQKYFNSIEKHPVLDRNEENALGILAMAGDKAAKDKLVVSNLRFVVQVAHKFSGYTKSGKISMLDLIQEGNEGLMRAVEKFDATRNLRLVSYAVWWIKAHMQNYVIKQYSIVKIGTTGAQRTLFFKMGAIRDIIAETDPTLRGELRELVAKSTNVKIKDIIAMEHRVSWSDQSTEKQQYFNNDKQSNFSLGDTLTYPDKWEDKQLDKFELKNMKELLTVAMEELNPREKSIVERRWLGKEKETLQTIGADYNLSRERIRQIESRALQKMHRVLKHKEVTF